MHGNLQQQLIETARAMNAAGLNRGRAGNLSVRTGSGMLITPSGMDCAGLAEEDLVHMAFDGGCAGARKPSSEWRFHAAIYREHAAAQAVLHAHPLHCTALACSGRGIPAFHYMVAVAGGRDIRCAEYATFGSEALSNAVLQGLQGRKACLLAHHGMVCMDGDLSAVLELAVEIEHLAAIYCQVLAIGGERVLDDAEMATVLAKFRDYRVG